jgi:hypothetical protein
MSGAHNPEAAAWSEMAFDASMIGMRSAVERMLLDLAGVSRAGGDVHRSRMALFALLREAEQRANAIPYAAGDPPSSTIESRPSGLAPHFSADPALWGMS